MLLNIAVLKNLHLTAPEREYLHQTCPYFQPAYLDYLEKLRLHPEQQVTVDFVLKQRAERAQDGKEDGQEGGGNQDEEDDEDLGLIELGVKGLWRECILYEVPLMAIRKSCFSASFSPCDMADPISVVCQPLLYRTAITVSEGYFLHIVSHQWHSSPVQTRELASQKAYRLLSESSGNLAFSEFGTRRRRSYEVQKEVIEGLRMGEERYWNEVGGRGGKKGGLVGTSNVSRVFLFSSSHRRVQR